MSFDTDLPAQILFLRCCAHKLTHYASYRDLRRYGTVPHAGFERALAYVTDLAKRTRRDPLPVNAGEREGIKAGDPGCRHLALPPAQSI